MGKNNPSGHCAFSCSNYLLLLPDVPGMQAHGAWLVAENKTLTEFAAEAPEALAPHAGLHNIRRSLTSSSRWELQAVFGRQHSL